ncbi:MAG: Asp-tRNA(Asn)/Glu-tRNA(Gln) amidotransferase subunit GatB [bacterium]
MKYLPTIGMEVHAQLTTSSKLFCGCTTAAFEAKPNGNTCPVCLGLPGVLPVLNRKAVEFVIKTALALNCEIPPHSRFARKNYFYPDLPKAYQISQYELPISKNGFLEITVNGRKKRIGITRVHLEEDTGKLIHPEAITSGSAKLGGDLSLIDYNRVGIPLMEIVSEADIASSEEAVAYLTKLRTILQYLGVCDGSMEKGSLRCEPNISIHPEGVEEWGTKTELKNLNSFKAVQRGIDFELKRQAEILETGGTVIQETRRWDDATQTTQTMRTKEHAHDYRYFPEPDLVPLEFDPDYVEQIRSTIPELPDAKKNRFTEKLALPEYDADILTSSRPLADYYEAVLTNFHEPKTISNWMLTELLGALNESGKTIEECKITPVQFAQLLHLIKKGAISGRIGKDVFKEMFATGNSPDDIIAAKGLMQVSDAAQLEAVVEKVIQNHPGPAADYRAGKNKALGFLVGQVMKETGGKANPQMVNEIIRRKLS